MTNDSLEESDRETKQTAGLAKLGEQLWPSVCRWSQRSCETKVSRSDPSAAFLSVNQLAMLVCERLAEKRVGSVCRDAVRLSGGGWLSWSELAPLVPGVKTVFLTNGTRLTPEAADRLLKLNVKVEEVF